jgi:hypothetical protein
MLYTRRPSSFSPPQNKNNGADWLAKLYTTHEMSAKEFSGDGKNEGRAGPAG